MANCTNQTKTGDCEGGIDVSCNHDYCTVLKPTAVDLSFSAGRGEMEEEERKKTEEAGGGPFQTVIVFCFFH